MVFAAIFFSGDLGLDFGLEALDSLTGDADFLTDAGLTGEGAFFATLFDLDALVSFLASLVGFAA